MSTSSSYVHCMLIPLQQHYVLLPNSTIAEVIPKKFLRNTSAMPDYWYGDFEWNATQVSVIDIESLIEVREFNRDNISKFCIINAINPATQIKHYAIPCCGSPQLITLNESALQQTHDTPTSDYLHCQIKIGSKVAYIPNLDQLEQLINTHQQ